MGTMDVRIGILSQTVLQYKLRQKQSGVEEEGDNLDELEQQKASEDEELDF